MTNDLYSRKGVKRYRIFIFSFIFGCIHVNDLAYIFPDETINRNGKELINNWGTMLNYLSAKKKMLEKLSNGYYTLKNAGIKDLYEHLQDKNLLPDIDYEIFKKTTRQNKVHVSHSCRTGRSILSFVNLFKLPFIVEPEFDFNGKLMFSPVRTDKQRFLSPDALIYSCEKSEKYFIEADSSTEKINSGLIPKFSKYTSSVLEEGNPNFTIQFMIWNNNEEDNVFLFDIHKFDNLTAMYDFISNHLHFSISFNNFIEAVSLYRGTCIDISNLSDAIKKIDVTGINSAEDLKRTLINEGLKSLYTKNYILRVKKISTCISRQTKLYEYLLSGVRLVCLPINSFNYLYKYIYLELFFPEEKFANFFAVNHPNFSLISYKKIGFYKDNLSGDIFSFRNMFLLKNDDKILMVFIENISDDLSGFLRVSNYINSRRNKNPEDIILYCLYNDALSDTKRILYDKSSKDINFISYMDFV